MTKQIESAKRPPVAATGTIQRNLEFDRILRTQLTDAEAAKLAAIAATHISGGTISLETQLANPGDALQAAQHDLGVNPALTGVVEDPNQPGVFAHMRKSSRPALQLAAGAKELDRTDVKRIGHEPGRE